MPPYAILALIFSAVIFVYGLIAFLTGDIHMIPWQYRYRAKMRDKKLYVKQLGKILMLCAIPPALSSVVVIWSDQAAIFILIGGMILVLWIGTKIIEKAN